MVYLPMFMINNLIYSFIDNAKKYMNTTVSFTMKTHDILIRCVKSDHMANVVKLEDLSTY